MKINNLTAVNLVNITPVFRSKKLPLKLSFALFYNLDILNPQVRAYELQRQELEKEYKDKGEYPEKLMELLNEEVEVAIKKVPMAELEKMEANDCFDKLSFGELSTINFMIAD